jgi:hypothetical protein
MKGKEIIEAQSSAGMPQIRYRSQPSVKFG